MTIISKLTLLLCLALVITAFTAVPASAASKGKLVKEHKYKVSYLKKGKWTNKGTKYYLNKYKYDKHGNLTAFTHKYRTSKSKKLKTGYTNKYKLTYKKGKLVKESYDWDEGYSFTEYQNGTPVRYEVHDYDGTTTIESTYEARYLQSEKVTVTDWESDEPYTYTNNYDIQTKNGYPVKITHENGSEKLIVTFYTKGAKKGLIKKTIWTEYEYDGDERIEDRYSVFKYSYKMKKGLVRSYTVNAVQKHFDGKVDKYKQNGTFKYTKKKAGAKRYRLMINSIVAVCRCDGANTYLDTYW